MKIPFTKMHGLGNSYIYINGFETTIEESRLSELSIAVSNPNFGIGSDGMILLLPSEIADVRMRIFNKDGSEAMNCGNGLRCVAKLAYELGYVTSRSFTIEAKAGVVDATVQLDEEGSVDQVTVDMGEPILERQKIPMVGQGFPEDRVINEVFQTKNEALRGTAVSMGNPHIIFFIENIKNAPLESLGPEVTNDSRFPEGVNVEFVEVVNSNELNFRVWERGSGVTQACGTGACAAGVASVLNDFSRKDEEITVHLDGGDLVISWSENGHVWMTGPAVTVAKGDFWHV
ncbi:diaminopimelate epimerase [Halalkalibacillus sediminis]|uniref:Diaminopimelate epimerase n=1 Tax=Halalkalibacillus sediminis TaxID=2018042 RepID=A0A2I0QUW6_9BACI|nr:diaminopimelate epimerase [Halalkalibacillus sediminis]PKR78108.1 diaminopimelate epimerase [Halalkalibacillus sediminis]